ncbi:MAG TPA: BrnA antitoxin family protein [Rhodopila sp.]|nr:BrnA antitoxin family protein [Rhodopila sp.]
MAKSAKAVKQSAKPRAASGARSRTAVKPAVNIPAAAETARNGWATDLVFDVREPKLAVSLRLDADVLRFFRGFGAGYQTRINEVLKAFMHARGGAEQVHRAMPPARSKHVASGNGKRAG